MNNRFAFLKIRNVILHRIYPYSEDEQVKPPLLSNQLKVLDVDQKNTLQERIINVMGKHSHCSEMKFKNYRIDSAFSAIDKMIFSDPNEFISISSELARKLANAQAKSNIPGGALVIVDGIVGSSQNNFVAIIKAELQAGFNMQESDNSVDMELLRNLFLTPHEKLYKIGFFILSIGMESDKRSPDDYDVFIFDENMDNGNPNEAAKYFYDTFLGCGVCDSNMQQTRDFYKYTERYIKSLQRPIEEKMDLKTALYTYINLRQSNSLNVSDFAMDYLPEDVVDDFREYMYFYGVSESSIIKDVGYLRNELKMRKLVFSSKVQIQATPNEFSDLIRINGKEDGRTIVSIKGELISDT